MLNLQRKRGEEIFIGDDITVVVVRTGLHSVELGIKAPREVKIRRGELERSEPESGKSAA